jgi:hypothetical protein
MGLGSIIIRDIARNPECKNETCHRLRMQLYCGCLTLLYNCRCDSLSNRLHHHSICFVHISSYLSSVFCVGPLLVFTRPSSLFTTSNNNNSLSFHSPPHPPPLSLTNFSHHPSSSTYTTLNSLPTSPNPPLSSLSTILSFPTFITKKSTSISHNFIIISLQSSPPLFPLSLLISSPPNPFPLTLYPLYPPLPNPTYLSPPSSTPTHLLHSSKHHYP